MIRNDHRDGDARFVWNGLGRVGRSQAGRQRSARKRPPRPAVAEVVVAKPRTVAETANSMMPKTVSTTATFRLGDTMTAAQPEPCPEQEECSEACQTPEGQLSAGVGLASSSSHGQRVGCLGHNTQDAHRRLGHNTQDAHRAAWKPKLPDTHSPAGRLTGGNDGVCWEDSRCARDWYARCRGSCRTRSPRCGQSRSASAPWGSCCRPPRRNPRTAFRQPCRCHCRSTTWNRRSSRSTDLPGTARWQCQPDANAGETAGQRQTQRRLENPPAPFGRCILDGTPCGTPSYLWSSPRPTPGAIHRVRGTHLLTSPRQMDSSPFKPAFNLVIAKSLTSL